MAQILILRYLLSNFPFLVFHKFWILVGCVQRFSSNCFVFWFLFIFDVFFVQTLPYTYYTTVIAQQNPQCTKCSGCVLPADLNTGKSISRVQKLTNSYPPQNLKLLFLAYFSIFFYFYFMFQVTILNAANLQCRSGTCNAYVAARYCSDSSAQCSAQFAETNRQYSNNPVWYEIFTFWL